MGCALESMVPRRNPDRAGSSLYVCVEPPLGAGKSGGSASMTAASPVLRQHGNAYNIFILVLTIFSLAIMVLLLLPITQAERDLLTLYDNIGLRDLPHRLWVQPDGRQAEAGVLRRGAWVARPPRVDPELRLLSRPPPCSACSASAGWRGSPGMLRGQAGKDLVLDVLQNRSQYATFITILLAGMVLSIASILVLEFESSRRRQHQDRLAKRSGGASSRSRPSATATSTRSPCSGG